MFLQIIDGQISSVHFMHRVGELEARTLQLISKGEPPASFGLIIPEGPLIRVQLALFAFTLRIISTVRGLK